MGIRRDDLAALKLLNGFCLLKRDPPEQVAGKIILVDKSADKQRWEPSFATVVRVGMPERHPKTGVLIPLTIKAGDRVVIDKYAGHDVEESETGDRYVIAAEQDVHLIVG